MLYTHVMDPAFRAPFPNVNRWFMTCVNQFEFKNIIGKVELCEKMAQFDNKKYNEIYGGKKDSGKKDKKPAQAKKEQKPKAEKAAAAPAAAAPKKEASSSFLALLYALFHASISMVAGGELAQGSFLAS